MLAFQEVVNSIENFTLKLAFRVIVKLIHLGPTHLNSFNKIINIDIPPLGIFD
jgi:hypothetical protein